MKQKHANNHRTTRNAAQRLALLLIAGATVACGSTVPQVQPPVLGTADEQAAHTTAIITPAEPTGAATVADKDAAGNSATILYSAGSSVTFTMKAGLKPGIYRLALQARAATAGQTPQVTLTADGLPAGNLAIANSTYRALAASDSALAGGSRVTVSLQNSQHALVDYLTVNFLRDFTGPTVSLSAPPTTAFAPAAFTLAATASAGDAAVTKVEFYRDGALVGTSNTAPYSAPVSALAAGNYSFTARAYDGRGLVSTSSARTVSVVPVTLSLGAAGFTNADVLTAPLNGDFTATSNAPLAKVDFTLERVGNDYGTNGVVATNSDSSAPYTLSPTGAAFDPSKVADGNYRLTASGTATNGAVAQASVTFFAAAGGTIVVNPDGQ